MFSRELAGRTEAVYRPTTDGSGQGDFPSYDLDSTARERRCRLPDGLGCAGRVEGCQGWLIPQMGQEVQHGDFSWKVCHVQLLAVPLFCLCCYVLLANCCFVLGTEPLSRASYRKSLRTSRGAKSWLKARERRNRRSRTSWAGGSPSVVTPTTVLVT